MAFCVDLDCPGECRVGVVGRLTISRSVQWKGIRARRFRVGVKVRRELSRLASWRRGRNSTILKVKREPRDRRATTSTVLLLFTHSTLQCSQLRCLARIYDGSHDGSRCCSINAARRN